MNPLSSHVTDDSQAGPVSVIVVWRDGGGTQRGIHVLGIYSQFKIFSLVFLKSLPTIASYLQLSLANDKASMVTGQKNP